MRSAGSGVLKCLIDNVGHRLEVFDDLGGHTPAGTVVGTVEGPVDAFFRPVGEHAVDELRERPLADISHKQLQLDDIENGDLLHTSEEEKTEPTGEEIVFWWNGYSRRYERE